jgi:ribose transport system permease protein
MSVQAATVRKRPNAGVNLLLGLTLLGLLALMWLALSVATNTFWTENNLTNLARQGAMIAILAIGETFVIITGGIDLSVGAVTGFCSMAIALFLAQDMPIWLAILATLGIGLAIGLFHAFGIVQLGLPPLS